MGKGVGKLSNKTKKLVSSLIVAAIAVVVVAVVLVRVVPSYKADDYVVQIWQPETVSGEPETLLAYGIVVDDSNHVLTVLDYEEYTPDKLLVVSPEYGTFNASIQAIDYRTSATLLQLQDADLPVAEIGDTSSLASSQKVYIRGWAYSRTNRYMKCPANAYFSDNIAPLFFSVSIPQEVIKIGEGWVDEPGAVITDKDSKAIGLLGRYWSKVLIISLPAGYVYLPLAINIDSALALLTDTSHTSGPAVCVVLTDLGSTDIVPGDPPHLPVNNIENLATNVTELLDELGEPVPLNDLAQYSSGLPRFFHPEEGNILIAAFTYPVELHDSGNNLLARAKWIGIHWDRSEGKPNRLIYGSAGYIVEGAYSIEGDISGLVQLLEPILSELGHCPQGHISPPQMETETIPLGYFELTVSPAEVCANIGEQIEIRCTIDVLINDAIEISSVDVILFDSYDSILREQAMTKDYSWHSANTVYTILGDEAYYQLRVNFTCPYGEPGEYSEYGAHSFPIVVNQE